MTAPRRLLLRLGTTCNNRCEHCTIRDLAAQPERTTVAALEELRRGRAGGCDELVIMRGEPLTRPDLLAIVGEAHALGYGHIQIQTNGRGLGAGALLDDLVRAGAGCFEISLYGPDAAVHDAVAGVPGAFAETVAGIAACRARALELLVTVPVVAANAVHLPATVALAARLGVSRTQLNFTRPLEGSERVVSNLEEGPREVRAAVLLGRELGLEMTVEALPPCILGGIDDALLRFAPAPVTIVDLHRTITDLGILRQIYRAPVAACRGCAETADCPVTWAPYLQELRQDRHLQPLPGPDAPEVDLCLVHAPWVVTDERVPRQWDLLALMPDAAPSANEAEAGGEFSAVPLGLESIRRYLEARSAFTVRLANLAGLYLGAADPHARLVQHLARLKARVFAVDLHWLTHAQGALEVLRLCRELHPNARTVLGGLSASHFAREILDGHAYVDFVVSGDGERPMLRLLEALLRGGDLTTVPNLWYRRHGRLARTRAAYFAEEESDYRSQPYVPVRRGCAYDCAHCGVGQTATAALFGPRARSRYAPEKVANEILPPPGATGRARLTGDPLLTFGAGGMRRFYGAIGPRGADLDLGVELQLMHGEAEIDRLARTFRSVRLSVRPDSGDEDVRRRQGKPYRNDDLLRCIRAAADRDNVTVAVTFLYGLAGDDAGSLDRSLALMRHITKIPSKRPIELRFLELWYLQPGSRALVDPAAHGYHAEWTDLASFRRQMAAPLFSGAVHFAPSALTRRGYVEQILRKHLEVDRLLVATGQRHARASQHVRAYVEAIAAMTDDYERFGPGGALAPPAEARRLGRELKARFLDRALGNQPGVGESGRVLGSSRTGTTDRGSIPGGGANEPDPGLPPRLPASLFPAFAPVPLADERARAVLDALGLAGLPARRVLGGRGELRVETEGGALTLLPAGTRSRAAARTDCFDLLAEGPLDPAVPAALQRLEREQPERLPLLFTPMQERPPRPPGAAAEKVEELVRVTLACNQRCLFCSVDPDHERSHDPAAVRRFIEARAGGPFIVFSGGEPTLDDRLPGYLQAARAAGYPEIVIQTNALRAAYPAYAHKLAQSGLHAAFVSLHSHHAQTADALTRTPGSFELTLRGIDALMAEGVRVWLNFVATSRNVAEAPAFTRFAAQRFPGVAGVCLSLMAPVGEGGRQPSVWPRLEAAGPAFAAALDVAAAAGIPAKVPDVCGLPLCCLPGHERFSECLRALPGEGPASPDRTHAPACAACRWRPVCCGFWRSYLERHGAAELQPQAGPPP